MLLKQIRLKLLHSVESPILLYVSLYSFGMISSSQVCDTNHKRSAFVNFMFLCYVSCVILLVWFTLLPMYTKSGNTLMLSSLDAQFCLKLTAVFILNVLSFTFLFPTQRLAIILCSRTTSLDLPIISIYIWNYLHCFVHYDTILAFL